MKSVRNILFTLSIRSNFGRLLYAVDIAFSISVVLARLVAKFRFSFNVFFENS
jgi:hypothetical protein